MTDSEDNTIRVQHEDGELLLYQHEGMSGLRYCVEVSQSLDSAALKPVWEANGDNLALLMQQAGEALELFEPEATSRPRSAYVLRIADRLSREVLDNG